MKRAEKLPSHMKAYGQRMREQGLRRLRLWVPDTGDAAFVADVRRQSAKLRGDPAEREILDWIGHATDTEGWS